MRQITFTSSLPVPMVNYLNEYSKKTGVPKNKILEKALRLYMEEKKRIAMIESFKCAALDEEMNTLAEEGISDYLSLLDK